MDYQIYRATIATGASAVSAIERLQKGQWVETNLSQNGKYVIPMKNGSTLSVYIPAAIDGTDLRFLTTYDPYLLSPVVAGDVEGTAIGLASVDAWVSKCRTCPAELLSRAYFEPSLTNTSGVAQTQSQTTYLIFVLKAPTRPGA